MAIPIWAFIGVSALAKGAAEFVKASINNNKAKENNESAEKIVERAKKQLDKARENTDTSIKNLGKRKIEILNENIKIFVDEFEKINNIELSKSKGLDELGKIIIDENSFKELKDLQNMATTIAGGLVAGTAGGALAGFGAYSATSLALASTGTPIATLSGIAAKNATLAFFGGGSIVSGGLGMKAGAIILGGLVTGPALAIMGVIVNAKARENYDISCINLSEARKYREEMSKLTTLSVAIRKRADMFNRFLLRLDCIFTPLVHKMSTIISQNGNDYRTYSDEDKKTVAEAVSIVGAIKAILDTPILDEDGNLTDESEKVLQMRINN